MEIHGLTHEQAQMLERIWNIKTKAGISTFASFLPEHERQLVWGVYELALTHQCDEYVGTEDDSWVLKKIQEIQEKYG